MIYDSYLGSSNIDATSKEMINLYKESSIYYVRTIFPKTNISPFLIGTRTSAYQSVRNLSFFGKFYERPT